MSNENSQPVTKKVEVTLTATTCVQYTEIVEVPADISPEDLNKVVNQLYEKVGADEYSPVGDSWERGSCGAEDTESVEPATLSAVRTAGGVTLTDIPAERELLCSMIRANAERVLKHCGPIANVEIVQMHDQVNACLASTNGDTGDCFVDARQLALLLAAELGQLRAYQSAAAFNVLYSNIRKNADYGDRPEGKLTESERAQLHALVELWKSRDNLMGFVTISARQLAILLAAAVK